jgi:hypothetical protein
VRWLKSNPRRATMDTCAPAHIGKPCSRTVWRRILCALQHLTAVMTEVGLGVLYEAGNRADLFPSWVVGSLDTMPIRVPSGPKRYQPKYSSNVIKFSVVINHRGSIAHATGPHACFFLNHRVGGSFFLTGCVVFWLGTPPPGFFSHTVLLVLTRNMAKSRKYG